MRTTRPCYRRNMRDGEKPMILRLFSIGRIAALLIFGLGFGAAPAAAGGCGYGCFAPAPVVVQPYYNQSCGCCGCGSSYYASYYPAYAYPAVAVGAGCCGYGAGYGVGAGYGYGPGYGGVVAPRVYRSRVVLPRYYGPRRYIGPRRVLARY
jgi:hypothetical protein